MSKFDFEGWLDKANKKFFSGIYHQEFDAFDLEEAFESGARAYKQESDKVIRELMKHLESVHKCGLGLNGCAECFIDIKEALAKVKEHLGDE